MSLNWLLVCIPLALGLDWYGASPTAVFCASALAIVPLAGLMGEATEQLSIYVGATIGGLMSASLGNAPELIISGFALKEGWGRVRQKFNKTVAGVNGGLLFVAAIGLLIPALFPVATGKEREVSTEIAVVLFVA